MKIHFSPMVKKMYHKRNKIHALDLAESHNYILAH